MAYAGIPAALENDPLDCAGECFPSYTTEQGQKQVTALREGSAGLSANRDGRILKLLIGKTDDTISTPKSDPIFT